MTTQHRPPAALVLALTALAALAGCRRDRGLPVADFDMKDLQAPAMARQLANGLGRAYLIELPERPVNERFDLALTDVTEDDVLEAVVALDPSFRFERRRGVIMLWPAGEAELQSPYSRRLEAFAAEGGAATVTRLALEQSGLSPATILVAESTGRNRPVAVDVRDASVRDVLAEIAAQAHLAMLNEPGKVRLAAAVEAP